MNNFNPTESLKKILTYLPSSQMQSKEKEMWMALIPHLDERLLDKLATILEKEYNYFLQIGLNALEQSKV